MVPFFGASSIASTMLTTSFGRSSCPRLNGLTDFTDYSYAPEDTHHLAVLFPLQPDKPELIGIPLQNPMGWVSSLLIFLACTETIADIANSDLANPNAMARARRTPHQFDILTNDIGPGFGNNKHRGETPPPVGDTTGGTNSGDVLGMTPKISKNSILLTTAVGHTKSKVSLGATPTNFFGPDMSSTAVCNIGVGTHQTRPSG